MNLIQIINENKQKTREILIKLQDNLIYLKPNKKIKYELIVL